ncbi:MAG: DUF378 domain-containing protein [Candidatus Paceibacterota bacterium]
MSKLSTLDWIVVVLVVVGAINWGLVGAFDFNLVDEIFGAGATVSDIIYILVGLSGLYLASVAGSLQKS